MLFEQLTKILQERIMILDGSMGAFLQQFKLTEEDFRGEKFKDHKSPLKGNNDILSITQPEIIKKVHRSYLEAGADIIETNTFNGTSISQEDYKTQDFVYEINFESAKIAKESVNEFLIKNTSKPRFVA
ncbi:MAG: homocysteine S-methyltransferase family protein, partial [Ignavibacteriae bacterium]|nr:homocysteine S-methyltransferase family protein [Ignavibacteriota bacterium]